MKTVVSLNDSKFNTFVTFDDGYKLRLPLKAGKMLQKGMILEMDDLMEEFGEEMLSQALDLSYRYLSYSMRLESEIRDYLLKKNFHEDTVEKCLEKLEEYGYLNDEAYVRSYMKSRLSSSNGRRKIIFELEKKGLDAAWVEDVVERLLSYDEEEESLAAFIEKQNRKYRNLFYREKKDRIINSAMRKGYSYDMISSLIEEYVTEDEDLSDSPQLRNKVVKRFEKEMSRGLEPEKARYRVFSFFYRKGYPEELLESVYEDILEDYYSDED